MLTGGGTGAKREASGMALAIPTQPWSTAQPGDCVRYRGDRQQFTVSLEDFSRRQASESGVLGDDR